MDPFTPSRQTQMPQPNFCPCVQHNCCAPCPPAGAYAAGWDFTPVCAMQLHSSHTAAVPLCRRKRRKLNQTRGRPCAARLHAASVAAEARAEGLDAEDEGEDEGFEAGAAMHMRAQLGGCLHQMCLAAHQGAFRAALFWSILAARRPGCSRQYATGTPCLSRAAICQPA